MNTFAVMFNEYDKWEQNDSRSLTFRSAKLLVQQDEWEQDESRSEALKAAALAEGMSQWEECSDRSSLFRRATAEVCTQDDFERWSEEQGRSSLFKMAKLAAEMEEWEASPERSDQFKAARKRALAREKRANKAIEQPRCTTLLLAVARLFRENSLSLQGRVELKSAIMSRDCSVYTALAVYEKTYDSQRFLCTLQEIASHRIQNAKPQVPPTPPSQWYGCEEYHSQLAAWYECYSKLPSVQVGLSDELATGPSDSSSDEPKAHAPSRGTHQLLDGCVQPPSWWYNNETMMTYLSSWYECVGMEQPVPRSVSFDGGDYADASPESDDLHSADEGLFVTIKPGQEDGLLDSPQGVMDLEYIECSPGQAPTTISKVGRRTVQDRSMSFLEL
jgi:hypothetical protein